MGKLYSGITGSLSVDGVTIGKVREWSLEGSAEALATTTLGDWAPTYRYGRQQYAGSCVVLYYADENGKVESKPLIGDVLQTGKVPTGLKRRFKLVAGDRSVEFDALVTDVSMAAGAGDVLSADVSFTVSGPLIEASLGGH
jgi:hypothetical protein